jgi:hypothetical protein
MNTSPPSGFRQLRSCTCAAAHVHPARYQGQACGSLCGHSTALLADHSVLSWATIALQQPSPHDATSSGRQSSTGKSRQASTQSSGGPWHVRSFPGELLCPCIAFTRASRPSFNGWRRLCSLDPVTHGIAGFPVSSGRCPLVVVKVLKTTAGRHAHAARTVTMCRDWLGMTFWAFHQSWSHCHEQQ